MTSSSKKPASCSCIADKKDCSSHCNPSATGSKKNLKDEKVDKAKAALKAKTCVCNVKDQKNKGKDDLKNKEKDLKDKAKEKKKEEEKKAKEAEKKVKEAEKKAKEAEKKAKEELKKKPCTCKESKNAAKDPECDKQNLTAHQRSHAKQNPPDTRKPAKKKVPPKCQKTDDGQVLCVCMWVGVITRSKVGHQMVKKNWKPNLTNLQLEKEGVKRIGMEKNGNNSKNWKTGQLNWVGSALSSRLILI